MSTAAVYIRKSVVQAGSATLSWEIQESEVRSLAARHGDADLAVFSDWGRSGRGEKTHLRRGYHELVAEIEAGHVQSLYAYSLSRLSRSTVEYARLAEICERQGVRLRTCKEGETDFSTAAGRLVTRILMVVAQMEAELAQERSRDMVRARRARGDRLGRQPYGERPGEDLDAVVSAWREAQSLHGTARRLNASGIPTRKGTLWRSNSVRSVLETSAPGLVPARSQPRVAAASNAVLGQLLRCHCGGILSPSRNHAGWRYRCNRAADDPGHGRASVAESAVLPWVAYELSRFTPPDDVLQVAGDRQAERESVLEDLRRLNVVYLARGMGDDEYADAKKALDAKLDGLDAEGLLVDLSEGLPDWAGDDPRDVNAWARSVLHHVQLDSQMRPVVALWRLPSWRGEPRSA